MDFNDLITPDQFTKPWQMNRGERLAMISILENLRPKLSLEIGTFLGGSLQVISHYSESVISLDIDPNVGARLSGAFNNVQFKIGSTDSTLPELVRSFNQTGMTPEFILIDADHTSEGVRNDISAILQIIPRNDTTILVHDSFNPDCREGILTAPWHLNEYVHSVEVDFMPGSFNSEAFDTATAGSMWSGLACAIMSPQKRTSHLKISQSQKEVFDAVLAVSAHNTAKETHRSPPPTVISSLRQLTGRVIRRIAPNT